MRCIKSLKVAFRCFLIRQFGTYKHSVWDGETDYARWEYKGVLYYLPPTQQSIKE